MGNCCKRKHLTPQQRIEQLKEEVTPLRKAIEEIREDQTQFADPSYRARELAVVEAGIRHLTEQMASLRALEMNQRITSTVLATGRSVRGYRLPGETTILHTKPVTNQPTATPA